MRRKFEKHFLFLWYGSEYMRKFRSSDWHKQFVVCIVVYCNVLIFLLVDKTLDW